MLMFIRPRWKYALKIRAAFMIWYPKQLVQNLAGAETSKGNFIYRLTPREKTTTSFQASGVRKNHFRLNRLGLFSRQNLQQAISNDLLDAFS